MRKPLLPLLASMMFASAVAQPEISEKWVITPVPAMKGILGKLDINFPAGIERNILIHQQSDNKLIKSVSRNDKIFTIAPGEYHLVMSSVPVDNVPIKKGYETRLKAGYLNMVSTGDWFLYDETKEKLFITGNKPQKIVLPVGNYFIKSGMQFYPAIINDGVMAMISIPTATSEIRETSNWVITPLEAMTTGIGKLSIIIPKDTTIFVPILNNMVTIPYNMRDTVKIRQSNTYITTNLPKYMATKTYDISLNHVRFSAPVRSGQETRIKAGFLVITKKENSEGSGLEDKYWDIMFGNHDGINWEWKLKSMSGMLIATGKKGLLIALPPGEYSLTKFDPSDGGPGGDDVHYKIIIKDGEWVKNGVRLD